MRWIVRIVSGLFMLAVLAVGLVYLIPSAKVAEMAAAHVSRLTGRELRFDGGVSPTIWPVLGVKTGPVSLGNAAWSDQGPMLVAEGLSIGVDFATLWGGAVRITKIEALNPQLTLERGKDGRGNWEFTLPAANSSAGGDTGGSAGPTVPGPATASPRGFSLDLALVHGGTLRFTDHRSGTKLTLTGVEAELRLPDLAGPATLRLAAQKEGKPLLVDARITPFADFVAGTVADVVLSGGAGASGVKFEGRLGATPLVAEGALTADLVDLGALMALIGQPAPDLPQGLGRSVRKVTGKVTLAPEGSIHLREGVLLLDSNRLTGDLDLTFDGPRPNLRANLKAAALDFAALTGAQGGKAPPAAPGGGSAATGAAARAPDVAGWSTAPMDASGLGAMDAAISLSADSVDLGKAQVGRTRALISVVKSRAVVELRELAAYGGNVTGQFVVNARSGLSSGGTLAFKGIALQPLLRDVAGYERLIGTGDLSLQFLAVGTSMKAMMHSLSGGGTLALGKGELLGLDLAGMLRTLDVNYVGAGSKTIFDRFGGSFSIKDGVLANDDLTLTAPLVTATGQGTVGIGARDLNYRLIPTALARGDGSGGVKVPLIITGPWADPKFRLDLKALTDEKLEEGKARLKEKAQAEEARAKARLEAKAASELGVVRGEGESLEDAAKRRATEALEAEARRALGKLFGGN